MGGEIIEHSLPPTSLEYALMVGHDGTNARVIKTDSSGNLFAAFTLDFTADIEITGTDVLNRGYTPAANGANTIIAVGAGDRIKVYKATLSPSADLTGEVYLSVGSTKIGTLQSPKAGGQYILVSCFPDFEYGALGDDLVLNLPSATTVSLNVAYEVITP